MITPLFGHRLFRFPFMALSLCIPYTFLPYLPKAVSTVGRVAFPDCPLYEPNPGTHTEVVAPLKKVIYGGF